MNETSMKYTRGLRSNWSRRPLRAVLLAATLGVTASLIASPAKKDVEVAPIRQASPQQHHHHWYEIGRASWYGPHFQGRKTANGERFNMYAYTCAHRTLPLGSWIRVTNLRNHKTAFVRVNDRGPVPTSRILDLSYAAAQKLGVGGLAEVKIERVAPDDPALAQELLAQLEEPANPEVLIDR
ncbi:MAG TPA: septal ring lytic transglycosylase RlpA family protein [Opitutaceae bacterium]|jgi:rare lipoprotein A